MVPVEISPWRFRKAEQKGNSNSRLVQARVSLRKLSTTVVHFSPLWWYAKNNAATVSVGKSIFSIFRKRNKDMLVETDEEFRLTRWTCVYSSREESTRCVFGSRNVNHSRYTRELTLLVAEWYTCAFYSRIEPGWTRLTVNGNGSGCLEVRSETNTQHIVDNGIPSGWIGYSDNCTNFQPSFRNYRGSNRAVELLLCSLR